MNWTALVPLKTEAARKSRLSVRLGPAERIALSLTMLRRLATTLERVPRIGSIHLLTDRAPERWRHSWIADRGRGLNAELEAARGTLAGGPLLVIHPDLPLVVADEVTLLLDAAERTGCAIVPDRHGAGTNALAMVGRAMRFQFGGGSFARHLALAGGAPTIVDCAGLTLDCDTPDDLDLAIDRGFACPEVVWSR